MTTQETALLLRWQQEHDAEAFAALVSRYSGLVYGTCRRMLGNPHDAQDAAQQCFIRLARADASSISYLGGWLHRVAANLCRDHVKSEVRRRRHERAYLETAPDAVESPWDDLQRHIDEAIEALPEGSRFAIQAHFLEGRTHDDIARELSITRSGVTHRIERGIEAIRRTLRELGVIVPSTTVGAFLAAQSAEAVPAPVTTALAKLGLAGPGATGGVTPTRVGLAGWLTTKTAIAVEVLVAIGVGVWAVAIWRSSEATAPSDVQSSSSRVASQGATARDALTTNDEIVGQFAGSVPHVTLDASAESDDGPSISVADATSPDLEATIAAMVQPVPSLSRADVEKALDAAIAIEFEDRHIIEIIGFLAAYKKIPIVLDWRVVLPPAVVIDDELSPTAAPVPRKFANYVTDGVYETLQFEETPLAEVLNEMLPALGLSYVAEPGYVWISTPSSIRREVKPAPDSEDELAVIEERLATDVTIRFADTHINETVEFLADYLNLNFVLDGRAVRPPNTVPVPERLVPGQPLFQHDPAYVTHGVVSYGKLEAGVKLRYALTALLRQLNLDFAAEEGFIWVSTPLLIANESFGEVIDTEATPADLMTMLEQPASIEFEKNSVGEILDYLAETHGLSVRFEDDSLRARINPEIAMKNVKMKLVVEALLRTVNLTYTVEGDGLLISETGPAPLSELRVYPETPPNTTAELGPELVLMDIAPTNDGAYRARIGGRGWDNWYVVGHRFEQYQLLAVDPDNRTCTILNEDTSERFTLGVAPSS